MEGMLSYKENSITRWISVIHITKEQERKRYAKEPIKYLEADGWALGVCDAGLGSANLMSVTRNLAGRARVSLTNATRQGNETIQWSQLSLPVNGAITP